MSMPLRVMPQSYFFLLNEWIRFHQDSHSQSPDDNENAFLSNQICCNNFLPAFGLADARKHLCVYLGWGVFECCMQGSDVEQKL